MVTCFGIAPFLLSPTLESSEFLHLITRDRGNWPRCLLWQGWLPGLSTAGERDRWAASLGQLADRSLEQVLGAYPVDHSGFWAAPDFGEGDDLANEIGLLVYGLMVARKLVPLVALRLLVLVYLPAPKLDKQGDVWREVKEW